ncbi:MAG: HDIG domain-containing protein [Bacteroidales bacterium]|nr:HDIG domain-containing protein [Bacteroidales bacterium]
MIQRQKLPTTLSWSDILRVSLYVVACLIVLYAIPKEGKFKYEYQKGSQWKHDDLSAPFDFAIYKTEAELEKERQEVRNNIRPYFNKDNQVQVDCIKQFEADFSSQLAAFGITDTVDNVKSKDVNVYVALKKVIYKSLNVVFASGVVDDQSFGSVGGAKNEDFLVAIQNEGITTQKFNSEIKNSQMAYQDVIGEIQKFLNQHQSPDAENSTLWHFCNSLNPSKWILPNLKFDKETTEKVLNDNLNAISLTSGFVQQRETIIRHDQLVDDDAFHKLESLRRDFEQHNDSGYSYSFLGQSILYVMLFALIFIFLRSFRREIFYQTKYSALILSIITFTIVMTSVVIKYSLMNIWLMPFLLLAIIIKTFFDTRTGMFLHIVTCVAVSFLMPNSFEYFTMQFIPGYILLMSYEKLNRRSQAFFTSVVCFAMYATIYVSFELMYTGLPSEINWRNILILAVNCIMLLMAYPLIYIFEKMFGLLSDVTLLELADSNRPLLRRLAEEAPGTFQHCMQVANLAEAAIFKIGGNPHLARTGALYHDIGKLAAPMYFTENQVSGINPHDQLDYVKSAEIIINHVIKGVAIAKEYNLPMQVIDFIKTHHGTSKAGYFYAMYKKQHPDEDCDHLFTYPGPRPINKEMAVVMMSDSIEAASRSLKKYDTESISTLVENIVNSQIANKQFDNTNLTFKDIDTVKSLLKEKLKNIYHARIEYPK